MTRLGDGDADGDVAAQPGDHVALAEPGAAVERDRQQGEHLDEAGGGDPAAAPGQLLDDEALGQLARLVAADAAGKGGAEETQPAHPLHEVDGKPLPPLPVVDDRAHLAVDEPRHSAAQLLELGTGGRRGHDRGHALLRSGQCAEPYQTPM